MRLILGLLLALGLSAQTYTFSNFGNVPAANQNAYSVVTSTGTTAVNLTTQGTTDWIHWGDATSGNVVHKASGGSLISTYTSVGSAGASTYTDTRLFSWTDGGSLLTATSTGAGLNFGSLGPGTGVSFTVPAGSLPSTLLLWIGSYNNPSGANLTLHLSDSSSPDYSAVLPGVNGGTGDNFVSVTFHAASAGQTLTVTWTNTIASGGGNVAIQAAALLSGSATGTSPVSFSSAIPTVAAGAAAGTSPTIAMVTGSTTNSGGFTLTTGTSPTTSAVLATVTFAAPSINPMFCWIYPTNAATAALTGAAKPYRSSAASSTSFVMSSNTTALTASTAYAFGYHCF